MVTGKTTTTESSDHFKNTLKIPQRLKDTVQACFPRMKCTESPFSTFAWPTRIETPVTFSVEGDEEGKVVSLIPIDHGYALPHTLEDVCSNGNSGRKHRFLTAKTSKSTSNSSTLGLDIEYLRENDIELQASSERVLRVCTLLLKESLKRDFTAANIASMLSRKMINRKSDIEKIAAQAASTAIAEGRSGEVSWCINRRRMARFGTIWPVTKSPNRVS